MAIFLRGVDLYLRFAIGLIAIVLGRYVLEPRNPFVRLQNQ